jgi:hypothetical protein
MQQVANRNGRDFGWEIAHEAVSRRPPISLYTMVARTEGYTCDASVWDFVYRSRAILCRPVPNLSVAIRNICHRAGGGGGRRAGRVVPRGRGRDCAAAHGGDPPHHGTWGQGQGLGKSRPLESRHKQDWFLKVLQGGRAHPLTACGVATLCCFPTDGNRNPS